MPNELAIALSQNKETFAECRGYLAKVLNSKEKVVQLENASIEVALPYYIAYIEAKGVDFKEAINYFAFSHTDLKYWSLLKVAVVNTFRKLENKDYNYTPF